MLTTLVALYSILVALNLLDGFSTWLVLKPNHYHRERNPVARWMFIKLGLTRGLVLAEVLWIVHQRRLFPHFHPSCLERGPAGPALWECWFFSGS